MMSRFSLALVLTGLFVGPVSLAGPGDDPRPEFGASLSISDDEEAALLEFVEEHAPDRIEQLQRLKRRDPARYARALQRIQRQAERVEDDPEAMARMERLQGLRHQIKALAIEHRSASDKDQKKLRKEMESLANQVFELRQEERRQRIEHIKAKLSEAEAEIADQDARRDAVIAEHLDRLLDD